MKQLTYELTRILLPLAIIGVGWGGFVLFGQKPEVEKEAPQEESPLVETEVAEASDGKFEIEIEGVALPARRVTLSAEVDGRIKKREKVATGGHYVTTNADLFEIDSVDYQFEVDRLTAQLEQASAELEATEVELSNTKSLIDLAEQSQAIQKEELERNEKLAKRGAVSDSALDSVRAKELTSRQSLQTLVNQAALLAQRKKTQAANQKLVQAQLNAAKEDLKRTKIAAPITGTVIEHIVEENDFVKRGDPLIRISESERMEVKTTLTVDELYWVWLSAGLLSPGEDPSEQRRLELPQTPVKVVFPFQGTEYHWNGILSRYEGSGLDAQTRTVPCRVLVSEPTAVEVSGASTEQAATVPALYSGMFVSIRIPIQSPAPLVKIPSDALRPGDQVWVVRDGKLLILPITIAGAVDDDLLVTATTDGIHQDDKVVTSPLAAPHDGLAVRIEEGQ